jgi:hypothetical protein
VTRPGLLAALALALLPGGTPAQDGPAHGPCLTVRPTAADYAAAFVAEGWAPAQGPARAAALRGPGEVIYLYTTLPDAAATSEALDERLARAHEQAEVAFTGASVLTRGEAAAAITVERDGTGRGRLRCVLAAPDLPEVDAQLARNPAQSLGDMTVASERPEPPEGASDLRLDAMRLAPAVQPTEPLAGPESITVSLTFEAPD